MLTNVLFVPEAAPHWSPSDASWWRPRPRQLRLVKLWQVAAGDAAAPPPAAAARGLQLLKLSSPAQLPQLGRGCAGEEAAAEARPPRPREGSWGQWSSDDDGDHGGRHRRQATPALA